MLSHRHVGATAGLHGKAHNLAFHEDEQQHKDLRSHSGAGGQACAGAISQPACAQLFGPRFPAPPTPASTGVPVQPTRSPTDTQASPTPSQSLQRLPLTSSPRLTDARSPRALQPTSMRALSPTPRGSPQTVRDMSHGSLIGSSGLHGRAGISLAGAPRTRVVRLRGHSGPHRHASLSRPVPSRPALPRRPSPGCRKP